MAKSAVSVKLTDDERERLSQVAKATKRSVHFLVREGALKHLAAIEDRLSFIQEAEEAWKHYKETGIYYSMDSMKAWAEKGGGELPPPEKVWEK